MVTVEFRVRNFDPQNPHLFSERKKITMQIYETAR